MGKLRDLTLIVFGAAAGAAASFFLDPDRGAQRRQEGPRQLVAEARRRARDARQEIDYRAGELKGTVAESVSIGSYSPPNDQTLKHKVESEVFGSGRFPKGSIVIDAHEGVIALRGQVDDARQREDLVEAISKVDGVDDVEDFLHLPGEPAPNVQPSRDASTQ